MNSIIDILKSKTGFVSLKPAEQNQIQSAEDQLDLVFANDFVEYIKAYGIASFSQHELTGICTSPRLNVVEVTKRLRGLNPSIPADFYVVEELNIDGYVICQNGEGHIYQINGTYINKIADSLLEYIS